MATTSRHPRRHVAPVAAALSVVVAGLLAASVLAATARAQEGAVASEPTLSHDAAVAFDLGDVGGIERKILGANNLEKVEAARGTLAYTALRGVAVVEDSSPDGVAYCTAFRVGPDLFLTNFHCDQGCDAMQFRLGVEDGIPPEKRALFHCTKLVHKLERLDYALYQATVDPQSASLASCYPPLTLSTAPLATGMALIVGGHPEGRTKELDRSSECVLLDKTVITTESGRDTVTHSCDTEGGSSGSPVIARDTGLVVGLHWGGNRENTANYAIPIAAIVEDLHENPVKELLSHLYTAE